MRPKILIITGPTASGKSGLALSLAEKLNAVIINADSQQMYRELRIVTARPSVEDEARAAHKLYGTLSAGETCSAGIWVKLAAMEIDWALSQGRVPIIVGGTGLYLKSLVAGIAAIPDISSEVRQQSINDYDSMGKDAFADRLKWIDPAFFERLAVYDRQRLIRAYEVWLGSGKNLSWWQSQSTQPIYPADYFALYQAELPRALLYERCDQRFRTMVQQGALDEVKQLLLQHIPDNAPIMKSLGVKELRATLAGESTLDETISAGQLTTRHYAKRQLTWMRHQLPKLNLAFRAAGDPNSPEILEEILNSIDVGSSTH